MKWRVAPVLASILTVSLGCAQFGGSGGSQSAAPSAHGSAAAVQAPHGGGKPENWVPVEAMHLYLCAFHTAKENPSFQVEAHHYCSPQGKDLHQCVVYDSKGANAKLLGIEYIVGDEVYRTLSDEEKKYWHPHAYEIVSGQLIAPDLPKQGDAAFPGFINTWGKTWHTWRDPATAIPTGEPILMWSANGDGQVDPKLVDKRDAQFGISTREIRERRKVMGYAVPSIPPPRSVNDLGRRWKAEGPDEPTKAGGAQ